MIQSLFNKNSLLEKTLNATWARNETISQNLANVDTPLYKRKDVAFEDVLNSAISQSNLEGRTTNSRHIAINSSNIDGIQPTLTQDSTTDSMRIDGNNVDVDSEMANLAKNTIKYNTLIQLINGSYSKIKNIIADGRR